MESKKSALFLVSRSLPTRNSVASNSSMGSRPDSLVAQPPVRGQGALYPISTQPRRMESKKSALFLVSRSLPTRNSVASNSSMG